MTAAKLLLNSALANLKAAMHAITGCTVECAKDCELIEHDGGEIDIESAVEEMLECDERIRRYLHITKDSSDPLEV